MSKFEHFQYDSCAPALQWPSQIPGGDRTPLKIGHRSFWHFRQGDCRNLLSERTISFSGHALVCPVAGEIHIGEGFNAHSCYPGQAWLFTDTPVKLTERFDQQGDGKSLWLFFNDRALAESISGGYEILDKLKMFLKHPASEHSIFFRNSPVLPSVMNITGVDGTLKRALTIAFNQMVPGMLKLGLNHVIIPRVRVQLFLERLILQPKKKYPELVAKYPGGRNALRREMDRLAMPSIAQFVQSRPEQIYQRWHEEGIEAARIAKAFHSETAPPFQISEETKLASPRKEPKADPIAPAPEIPPIPPGDAKAIPLADTPLPEYLREWLDEEQDSRSAAYDQEFLEMKNTGVLQIVSGSTMSKIADLNDWEALLEAA